MQFFIALLLIQLPLSFGASDATNDGPACGRCRWSPKMLASKYKRVDKGYKLASFNETIKAVKNEDGCLEAKFICPPNSLVRITSAIMTHRYHDEIFMDDFSEWFEEKIVCKGKETPFWTIISEDGKEEEPVIELFCLKEDGASQNATNGQTEDEDSKEETEDEDSE